MDWIRAVDIPLQTVSTTVQAVGLGGFMLVLGFFVVKWSLETSIGPPPKIPGKKENPPKCVQEFPDTVEIAGSPTDVLPPVSPKEIRKIGLNQPLHDEE